MGFKPYFIWLAPYTSPFFPLKGGEYDVVLNLILSGQLLIHQEGSYLVNIDEGFKPYFRWLAPYTVFVQYCIFL